MGLAIHDLSGIVLICCDDVDVTAEIMQGLDFWLGEVKLGGICMADIDGDLICLGPV